MLLGLVATLAMWLGGLRTVKIDRNGLVREPTAAAKPRERSLTGP
jgi:spore maturation protein SpmA